MACLFPVTGYRVKSGFDKTTGSWPVTFNIREGFTGLEVIVPCGNCIECRLEKSRQWAVRLMHEAQMHEQNTFITLTYNDENLPKNQSIDVREFQLFMKRLRKTHKQPIRYFHCGEYGQRCKICNYSKPICLKQGQEDYKPHQFHSGIGRPHYHALLFGIEFKDKQLYGKPRDTGSWYTSEILTKIWGKGFCTIGEVTFDSAAYVARYVTKKITGDKSKEHYEGKDPEYITMSRRPGIGRTFYDKYKSDMYSGDTVVTRDGRNVKIPRYYDAIYQEQYPEKFKKLKKKRRLAANEHYRDYPEEYTFERRTTKEKHKKLLVNQTLKRKLEES